MSEAVSPVAEDPPSSRRSRLAAPLVALLALACCVGAPLIVGAFGAASIGAVFGLVAGGLAVVALCAWAARRLSGRC